jgi:hypothetical protein
MELTAGTVITIAVVVIAWIAFIRWGRRHEAAAPVDVPRTPARSNTMTMGEKRESDSLVSFLLDRASEQTGLSVADDALARERITQAAAQALEDLRASGSATISLPFLTADAKGPKHFEVRVQRGRESTFELQR